MNPIVILSEAKDLLSRGAGKEQVLRFAQDDKLNVRREFTGRHIREGCKKFFQGHA
jgi:hypothetical protein